MPGVSYALADYVTGGPIVDLPVLEGADWAAQLNRPDALGCTVDLRDADAAALDLRSASEPKKTVLLARTDDDIVLAWGLIDEREWDEDEYTLTLTASGVRSSFFGHTIIAPVGARTISLTVVDPSNPLLRIVNPALNTTINDVSLGTIGKKLVQARLGWPGAPVAPFVLPADEASPGRTKSYEFTGFKSIESALNDLSNLEGGPDFAFDAQRGPDGLSLLYVMRHGTEAEPRIGTHVGSWSLGGDSPITGLKVTDTGDDMGSAAWLTAGKSSGTALISRVLNDALINDGYPPLDIVDTSHTDVSVQDTLDSYGRELASYGSTTERALSFTVRGDATPGLGAYRPGDTVTLDVPKATPATPWVEAGRQLIRNPRPSVFAGSGWSAPYSPYIAGEAVGSISPGASATPYIFTALNDELVAAGTLVRASIIVQGGVGVDYARVCFRGAGAYVGPLNVVALPTGVEVTFEWSMTATVDYAPGTLQLAVVPTDVAGGFIRPIAGAPFTARRPYIGRAPGAFFDGNLYPDDGSAALVRRTRWLGAVGNSASVLETRDAAIAAHPYLTDSFDVRITSMGGDETGSDVKIGCVILDG